MLDGPQPPELLDAAIAAALERIRPGKEEPRPSYPPKLTIAASGPGLTDAQKAAKKKKAAFPDPMTLHKKLFEATVGFQGLEQIAQHMMLGQGTPGSPTQVACAHAGPYIVNLAEWVEGSAETLGQMGAAKALARVLATAWVLGLHTLAPPEHVPILATQLVPLLMQEFGNAVQADADATKALVMLFTEKRVREELSKPAEPSFSHSSVGAGLSVVVDNTEKADDNA